MIYGRLVKPRKKVQNNKFFHKRSIKKKTYTLTEPSSNLNTPPHPIIKDHIAQHIRSTENAISDLYSSKKPTSLKIQSLGKNLSKLATLNSARKQNRGVFRISRPPPQHPQPNPPPPPRKKRGRPRALPEGGEVVVRDLFDDPNFELDLDRITQGDRTPVRTPVLQRLFPNTPVRAQARGGKTPARVQPNRAKKKGRGLLTWAPNSIWRNPNETFLFGKPSRNPFLIWK